MPGKEIQVRDINSAPDVEFMETIRYRSKPVVHIVHGESGLGKSTLFMDNPGVFETDAEGLTEAMLTCSVIVVGNRHKLTPQDVIEFFYKHEFYPEFVFVEFSN